jgi:hypothetical protein
MHGADVDPTRGGRRATGRGQGTYDPGQDQEDENDDTHG